MNCAPRVREITLEADGIPLSALLGEPRHGAPPRAVVVAVHGGGMSHGYFHSQAAPGQSLVELGANLGWSMLAIDRPGYGASAKRLPEGQTLAEQSETLHAALAEFARTYPIGAGFFVLAHSYGGKLALSAAARRGGVELLGLEISGCGSQYAVDLERLSRAPAQRRWKLNWGAPGLYPADTFRLSRDVVSPVPPREAGEARYWPGRFPGIAARIHVPVRFTFAEHEYWWRHEESAVAALLRPLSLARTRVERQPHAGHNISLGWAARSYHLKALAFLEECLLEREVAAARPQARTGS